MKMRGNTRVLGVGGIRRAVMGLGLVTGLLLAQSGMAGGPAPVDLGSCSNFAILAATAVSTDGGSGMVNGDVGLSPGEGSSITVLTAGNVNGTIYTVSAGGPAGSVVNAELLSVAQSNLTTAYLDAQGRTADLITLSGDIGGQTLTNGLYWSSSTLGISGDLTLDALGDSSAVWIFQVGSALTTASGPGASRVILANGARAQNVFWQVDTATLGSYSVFKGTIMAQISITMGVGSSMEGRALARTGAVTFNNTGSPAGTNGLPLLTQAITNFIPTNGSSFVVTNLVGLSAQATSLLPVSFTVESGPGMITGGTNLSFTATGLVSIVASQAGNAFYEPAASVTSTYNVLPVPLLSQVITNFIPTNGSSFIVTNLVGLSAQATSLLPVSFTVENGPGMITGGTNLSFTATGLVSIVASQAGDAFYDPAASVTNTYNVLPVALLSQMITNFIPTNGSSFSVTSLVGLSAQATSLLPVTFTVGSGPGMITGGTNLSFTATGLVSIVASQTGNTFYAAAPSVTNTFFAVGNLRPINDFDGDGVTDISLYDDAGEGTPPGSWFFLENTAGYKFSDFGYAGTVPVSGYFDSDSKADYGVYDAAGHIGQPAGSWYVMNSTNGFETFVFGYAGTVPVVGDFDGDGIDDFGVYDVDGIPGLVTPGTWYIMKSTEGFETFVFGYAGTVPVVGDFDGDGIDDFGLYDADGHGGQPAGSWYMMNSTNGFETFEFGYAGTVPVVGDFDGDSIDDFGVYDADGIPGSVMPGSWYIMKSTEGFETFGFGYAGTVPVVGDFDGDGTEDFVVYDAAGHIGQPAGSWYMMKSTDGFDTEPFGYEAADAVAGHGVVAY